MKHVKRSLALLLSLGLAATLVMALPAGATTTSAEKSDVVDSEFVFCTLDWSGEIEEVQVFEILTLKGDGTFDVREKKAFDEDTSWQGVKGFTKPKVEGDYLVWEGLKAEDSACYIANTKFSESMVEEARTRIPLEVRFRYKFDGVEVTDLNEITGKSGRFEMELTLRNASKEKTRVEYKDPETGEMKETEVDTYLPMVILPYDWYFDNRIFYNLEADPTGIVVPMPDFFNVGWSIPLFPPATQESHTIWVKADVKNFQMPPLTLAVTFIFPHTNQVDTTSLFKAGLEQLYGGVKQLNEGVGDPSKEDTLLYGITAVDNGLRMMADAQEGLPYAKANLDSKMIPGVRQAAAGIGSATTDGTLLYAVAQVIAGLQTMAAGIGAPNLDKTLLYAMAGIKSGLEEMKTGVEDGVSQLLYAMSQMQSGLEQIKAGIGSEEAPETLLYALSKLEEGLAQIAGGIGSPTTSNTLLYAMAKMEEGLEQIKAGIGDPSIVNTLLFAVAAVQNGLNNMLIGANQMIAGIGDASTPGTLLNGLAQVIAGIQLMSNGLGDASNPLTIIGGLTQIATSLNGTLIPGVQSIEALLSSGGSGVYDYVDTIPVTDPNWPTTYEPNILGMLSAYATNLSGIRSGLSNIYDALTAPGPNGIIANLQYAKTMMDTQIIPGLQQIVLGLDNPSGMGIKQGLQQIAGGIGSPSTPGTLLYAMAMIQAGLQNIANGIGEPTVEPTLLYAVSQVQGGLMQILGGIGPGTTPEVDTLLEVVAAMQAGLEGILAGIGDPSVNPSLLYAAVAVQGGLMQLLNAIVQGIGPGTTPEPDTLLEAVAAVEDGLNQMKAGIGDAGTNPSLLFAMAAMQMGLTQMKAGLSTGSTANPGLLEGLQLLSAGLGDAIVGIGSSEAPNTLLYGTNAIKNGLTQVGAGTQQMVDGLYKNLVMLNTTSAELEAIAKRGEEFDHLLGRAEDAKSQVRFVLQTKPTYNYKTGNKASWVVAVVLSIIFAILLVGGGIALSRRGAA